MTSAPAQAAGRPAAEATAAYKRGGGSWLTPPSAPPTILPAVRLPLPGS